MKRLLDWFRNWVRLDSDSEEFKRILGELKGGTEDIRPSDVVTFSEPLRSTLNHAIRDGIISLTDFAAHLQIEKEQARKVAEILIKRQLFVVSALSNEKETHYETRVSAMTRPMKRPPIDLLKKLDD